MYEASLAELPEGFLIAPMARAKVCDDVAEGLLPVKAMLGFYIGGMGHAARNFHADLMARMGYEEEARRIQRLFLDGPPRGGRARRARTPSPTRSRWSARASGSRSGWSCGARARSRTCW